MTALEDRCAEAKQIVLDLMGDGMLALRDPSHGPALLGHIRALRAVADRGVEGIEDASYLQWQQHAPATLDAMADAVGKGDYATSWAHFTDKEHGINLLGLGCQGCPGW